MKAASGTTKVYDVPCDLMSFAAVRKAAVEVAKIASGLGGLDVLALNAGIMAMADERTEDGLDVQRIVTEKVAAFPMPRLEQLILDVASRELRAIELLGGALGVIIGFAQVGLLSLL